MNPVRRTLGVIIRFLVVWFVDMISVLVTAWILPGIAIQSSDSASTLVVAAAAAFVLGVVNLLVRPLLLLLALPFGSLALLGIGFFVNAITLKITAGLLPGFQVDSWIAAFAGGFVVSAVNTVITSAISIDDADSFYQGLVERLAKRQSFPDANDQSRGLVMLEIDGLSYWHLKKALEDGLLPTLTAMMEEDGYQVSRVDCGLPSQTSACQAGIMFGDNHDIPAFRWYDKDRQKLFVSSKDAAEINARYAQGRGLMHGGTSVNNMLDGDATKSLLTLSTLRTGTPEEKKRRADDIYLLLVNPYFLMRSIVLLLGDAILEVYQGLKQRARNVQPRLNRLAHFYPVARAATVTFLRDVGAYLVTLDVIRGTPSVYTTWPGYDEVAHHSGPWTHDAFDVLERYDHTVARIRDIIRRKAPRPYDLILLSDHGQSFGATFKQRYGVSLHEFIEQQMPQGTTVSLTTGGDDGSIGLTAVAGELDNIQQQGVGGRVGGAIIKGGQAALQADAETRGNAQTAVPANVTVCGSGNLGQVYFDLHPRRLTRNELDAAYPGMFDALVAHEGIGVAVAYADDGAPIAWGKQGSRNLHTGAVRGEDPLKMYGDPDLRAAQVRRVADFPHSGDIMVVSTVYPDGTVAAMEELIGSHGGMGGEQTDAFIFHPADMAVPETTNSVDMYHILNAQRGLPPRPPKPPVAKPSEVNPRAPATLLRGLKQVGKWLGLAVRAISLDRSAFRAIAADATMTGPALLIGLLSLAVALLADRTGAPLTSALERLGHWLFTLLAIYFTGQMLTRGKRGQGSRPTFAQVFRALGFAQGAYIFLLLAFVPALAPVALLLSTVINFFATWVGAAEVHDIRRGWRTLLFPVVTIIVVMVVVFIATVLLQGLAFSLETLGQGLGLR